MVMRPQEGDISVEVKSPGQRYWRFTTEKGERHTKEGGRAPTKQSVYDNGFELI